MLHDIAMKVKFTASQPGQSKRDDAETNDLISRKEADPKAAKVTKAYLNAPHIVKISSRIQKMRQIVSNYTRPWDDGGWRIIQNKGISELNKEIEKEMREVLGMVEEIPQKWESDIVPELKKKLGDLYNEADYLNDPKDLVRQYDFRLDYEAITDPNDFRAKNSIPKQELEKMEKKYVEKIEEVKETAKKVSVARINETLKSFIDIMDEGNPKYKSRLANMIKLADNVSLNNLDNDPEMEALAETIRNLGRMNPETVKRNRVKNQEFRQSLADTKDQAEKILEKRVDAV